MLDIDVDDIDNVNFLLMSSDEISISGADLKASRLWSPFSAASPTEKKVRVSPRFTGIRYRPAHPSADELAACFVRLTGELGKF